MEKKIVALSRLLVATTILVLSAHIADAQTTYYSRASSTDWNSASTWSTVAFDNPTNTGTFPIAGDNVFIGGSGSSVVITGAAAACATLSVASGSLLTINEGLDVSGTTSVSGSLFIANTSGTKTFGGLVTVTGSWFELVNEPITFGGGIDNSGSFLANSSSLHTFSAAQTLSGILSIPRVRIQGAGNFFVTNSGTLTVTDLIGTDGIQQGNGATLNIGSISTINNMIATATGNTVNYTGSAQTVNSNDYYNLGLSGSGAKTLQAGTTAITGNLILSGTVSAAGASDLTIGGNVNIGSGTTFTAGGFNHNVGGDWINNGSFSSAGSIINLNGAAQNISGNTTTFNDLQLSGTGIKTFGVSTTINGEVSIATGAIANLSNANTFTSNTLILGGALQGSGTWGSTSSSPAATNQSDTFFNGTGLITVANGGFTYYSIASTNWNLPTTWSTLGFGGSAASSSPGAGDYVIIGDGQNVVITGTQQCDVLLFDENSEGTLSINSGSLTIATSLTIPQSNSGSNILSVAGGNLISPNLDFTAGGGSGHQLSISTGNATINGDVTGIGASSTVNFSGTGVLQVGGAMFNSTNGTLAAGSGTIEYNGSAQTIQALSYNNLTLSGSGDKTLAATTTIGGDLVVGDNTNFIVGGVTLTVTGTTTVGGGASGTLSITANAGTKTFSGLVTIVANGTWSNTSEAVTYNGGITNNGTFSAGTGTQTFNSNPQTLSGLNPFVIENLTVNGGATLTNDGIVTVNNTLAVNGGSASLLNNETISIGTDLSGTGTITQGNNATLNIGGTSGITNMSATATGNTVNYIGDAPAQTIKSINYVNLGLSGAAAKTAVAGLTITGNVTLGSGTSFTGGAFTHNVGGNWTNNGATFVQTGSTIVLNGAGQTIGGSSATPFNNLSFTGSGTKVFGLATIISGTFSVGNGVVADLGTFTTHTSNILMLGGALQVSGTYGGTGSGATNINTTFFAANTGLITVATGDFTYYLRANGDWNVASSWSTVGHGDPTNDGTFPGASNFAVIGGGFTVTVAADAVCSNLSFDAGTSVTNTLTINLGNTLTVSGAVTIPQTITSGSNILDVGAGNLQAGSIAFTNGSPGGTGHRLTISTGTAIVSGNINGSGASSNIEFTNTGLLQLAGSIFSSTNGTLTAGSGTMEYNGSAQTIEALSYNNLTLSGSGDKTLAATTTIGGNLVVGDNTNFIVGGVTLTVTGTTTVGGGASGTLSLTANAGAKTFNGLVTIVANGTWSNTSESVTFRGGITNNGIFSAGTGTQTFNSNPQTLSGLNPFVIENLTVNGGATLTNDGIVTVNNTLAVNGGSASLLNNETIAVGTDLSGTGTITQGNNAILNIGGTSGINNMIASATGNTVNYTGAAQIVKNVNYENLGLSGSGTKVLLAGTTDITGNLTLSGTVSTTGVIGLTIGGNLDIGSGTTFTSGNFTHNVAGDWINNGTFTGTGSTINLNGAAQNIIGVSTTFNDLTLAGSGTKVFGVSTAISDILSINAGVVADLGSIITHTANRIVLDGALQSAIGTWGSSGSSATNQNDIFFLISSSGEITISVGGNTYYSIASTAWNVNTTWSNTGFGGAAAAGTPGAGDYVFIGDGFSVSVAGTETCAALNFDAGTSVTNTLTINTSNSLTVLGEVTIPQTVTSGTNILAVGAGTLSAGSVAFTSTPGGAGHQMTISTGTATVSGAITGIGASSTIQFTGAGLLQVGSSMFSSTNGTLVMPAGTVEYNGADQVVEAHTTYGNIILSGSGAKTLSTLTNTIINGNLVVGDNTAFNVEGSTLLVNGSTTVGGGTSGILSITSTTGTKTFAGSVTINPNGTWTNTAESVVFRGGITNNGAFTAGTGTHTFNTNSQILSGTTPFTINNLTVSNGGVTLTNNGTVTVSGTLTVNSGAFLLNNGSITTGTALSGIGTITQGTSATLNIGGASTITNMTATAGTNTVNYTGTGQTVKNINYVNLGLSGSGIKTLQVGTTSIAGNLTMGGTASTTGVIGLAIGGILTVESGATFTSGDFTHSVNGNFINNGTFNSSAGTVSFGGSSLQTISGTTTTDFNNITISNTTGVSIESNQNLRGVLTLAASAQFDADGTSNSVFTLLSAGDSPTQDASIAALPAGASVTGNVTVQRYMSIEGPNSGRIYRYISSPVQSAPVSQIQNFIPVTGTFTGTSPCSGCGTNQSMFSYDETVITGDLNAGYVDFPDALNSETFAVGVGYAIFIRGNVAPVSSAGSALYQLRGPIISGDRTLPVSFNSSGTLANDGWNLVGNPYPSTIDWDAGGWTKINIDDAIYMRDNATGLMASYVGGMGANGGSNNISSGQAFWVKGTGGTPVLETTEAIKAAGTQTTFFREGVLPNVLRLKLKKGGVHDEIVVRYSDEATDSFDPAFDAYKLKNATFNLASIVGDTKYSINSLSAFSCSSHVQLDISDAPVGTYQLELSQFDSFEDYIQISLMDKLTGTTINARTQSVYEFGITNDVVSSGDRFIVTFSKEVDTTIVPAAVNTLCLGSEYTIYLPNTESNVSYYASLDGTTISEEVIGSGSTMAIDIDESKLSSGSNTVTIFAKRESCDASPLLNLVEVSVDRLYSIESVTNGSSCQSGSVSLTASGAPDNGSYKWYESMDSVEPINGANSNTYTTPVLDKSKTYYVTAVNSFGCEGEREQVRAEIVQFDDIVISEPEYGILTSTYSAGNVWYFNDVAIDGGNTQSITADQSGVYKVEVSIGSCKTVDSYEFVVTGIESGTDNVRFYPNPVTTELIVDASGKNIALISLISNTGVLLKTQAVRSEDKSVSFDMNPYPPGLYIVKLISIDKSVSTHKIMKR